jgi:hypothetical protein
VFIELVLSGLLLLDSSQKKLRMTGEWVCHPKRSEESGLLSSDSSQRSSE